jgi:hypothetical protein
MNTALLVLTLLSAEEGTQPLESPGPEVAAPVAEPQSEPPTEPADAWPGESNRRVHWGIGARIHAGALDSVGGAALVAMSEVTGFMSLRVFGHHEWRFLWGLAAGWPDTVAGESNVSFRFNLHPRFSVGAGLLAYWGFWSMRGGVEVPFAVRLGSNRRHEITLALRATAGGFNRSSSFVWYDFKHLSFAWSGDVVLGYTAIF